MDNKLIPIADFILSKLTYKRTVSLHSFLVWAAGEYARTTDAGNSEIVLGIVRGGKESGEIIQFYIDNDYIDKVNNIPQYELNLKGRRVNELGGHENYLSWESTEKQKADKEKEIGFTKKYPILYDTIKIIVSLVVGIGIGHYGCNSPISKSDIPSTIQKPKQIEKQKPSLPSPKILSKKDSV